MRLLFFLITVSLPVILQAQIKELYRFSSSKARQAVAVDTEHLYVIDNSAIEKVSKRDFTVKARWQDSTGNISHLNSGIVINDTLYCASSNYPHTPMTSSIEIFATDPLVHISSHSFGIFKGSCTWILQESGFWWAFFAHYENKAQSENRGVEWSTLVKFDREWKPLASWVLPEELLSKIRPYSLSGGIFVAGDQLLVSGHHAPYLYQLAFPESGSKLIFTDEFSVPIKGQGIALDPSTNIIWGIDRSVTEVIGIHLDGL